MNRQLEANASCVTSTYYVEYETFYESDCISDYYLGVSQVYIGHFVRMCVCLFAAYRSQLWSELAQI